MTNSRSKLGIVARKPAVQRGLLATVLSLSLGIGLWWTSRPTPTGDDYGPVRPYAFSIVRWELSHAPAKWFREAVGLLKPSGQPLDAQSQLVEEHANLVIQLGRLEAQPAGTGAQAAERLQEVRDRLADISPQVELIVQGQLDRTLTEAGFGLRVARGTSWLLPPLSFTITSTPHVLVLSPRERIELKKTFLLRSGLDAEDMESIESSFEKQDLSALVDDTGGIATYPSLLPRTASTEGMLSTVAHEWFHQYLFFHPLGRRYQASYAMTTINETVANMAGKEIAGMAMARYYGTDAQARAPRRAAGDFDFPAAMRDIRTRVDAYLSSGDIAGAERFMEEQRQALAARGYKLRKLNQAYLAFHSSYADEPGFSSAIGDQLRELRRRSASLAAFVASASRITSPDDLPRLLAGN